MWTNNLTELHSGKNNMWLSGGFFWPTFLVTLVVFLPQLLWTSNGGQGQHKGLVTILIFSKHPPSWNRSRTGICREPPHAAGPALDPLPWGACTPMQEQLQHHCCGGAKHGGSKAPDPLDPPKSLQVAQLPKTLPAFVILFIHEGHSNGRKDCALPY